MKIADIEAQARQLIRDNLASLESEDPQEDMEGDLVKSVFLGTVFHIMPSGKYYMPFACSNVDPCPQCKGAGTVPNPRKTRKKAASRAFRCSQNLLKEIMRRYGPFCAGEWPRGAQKRLEHYRAVQGKNDPTIGCPTCNGVGSREAYEDQCFSEAMEAEASEHGCFVQSGEGDPCDLFLCKVVEPEPDDEEEDEEPANQPSDAGAQPQ